MWIEIQYQYLIIDGATVTPLAGVWIEIMLMRPVVILVTVTPLAGVWIEILAASDLSVSAPRHPPRGGVD